MFHRTRSLLLVAGGLAAVCGADAAAAQTDTHRPDADGYPCAAHGRLLVVQDQQGFSITSALPDRSHEPVTAITVPLGTRLKLDRALFVAAAGTREEASDAPRR